MYAALQQNPGTMRSASRKLTLVQPPPVGQRAQPLSMKPNQRRQFHILGVTTDGRTFRPSDWSERLAGAMSSFRPKGAAGGIGAYIGYSPYCVPQVVNGLKCVLVSEALKGVEPMAWDFVMNFARDNHLPVVEVGAPADPGKT